MSAYGDIHVTDSFNYVSRSFDGGLTWDEPRLIGDGGLSHLMLPDGSALVLPYYLRSRGNGAIGAPCNIISPSGELSFRPSGVTVTGWPKKADVISPHLDTASFVFNGQTLRGRNGEYLATLYGTFDGEKRYSLVLTESEDGFAWRIRALIAGADCVLEGAEGPCESAICRLSDGRLMCIFRLASFVPYGQAFSSDDGCTWSVAASIPAMSVEPSLAVLHDGCTPVLSGGRSGIFVWFNTDGIGRDWQAIDVVAAHNSAVNQCDRINPDSTKAWQSVAEMRQDANCGYTSSYTELMALDERSLLLIYDRLGFGWWYIPDDCEETKSVWVIRLQVQRG